MCNKGWYKVLAMLISTQHRSKYFIPALVFCMIIHYNTNRLNILTAVYNSVSGGYTDQCQDPCQCLYSGFTPVCGSDNIVYFSSCHAGCTHQPVPVRHLSYSPDLMFPLYINTLFHVQNKS